MIFVRTFAVIGILQIMFKFDNCPCKSHELSQKFYYLWYLQTFFFVTEFPVGLTLLMTTGAIRKKKKNSHTRKRLARNNPSIQVTSNRYTPSVRKYKIFYL
jgi:hypothetical protein